MRKIKFRAWDAERQEMYGEGHGMMYGQQEEMDDSLLIRFKHFEGEPIFMQYTGLKDKNGKEIYEGDIIQYDNERYEVYWSEDWAMYTVKGCQVQALMRYASHGEVIGNIYQNPELLK